MFIDIDDQLKRTLEDVSLDDIGTFTLTDEPYWDSEVENRLHIPLDPEPTPEQQAHIKLRLTTSSSNEETVILNARSLMTDLRTIRDSSGTLTAAQLSNAVRVLARGEIGIIRLLLRDLDGTG